MSKINDIQSQLITVLQGITTAGSYNTNVKVVDDVVLAIEHLNPENSEAAIQLEWLGEPEIQWGDQSETAVAQWGAHVGMKNATFLQFTGLYDDIKAVLARNRTLNGNSLTVLVISSDVVNASDKQDNRYREAMLTVNITYTYAPEELSGP